LSPLNLCGVSEIDQRDIHECVGTIGAAYHGARREAAITGGQADDIPGIQRDDP
jgi:hypothetical protein